MKRETKVVIIGVIRLSIAIGVGIFGLIIGEVGWACIMLLVAIFMGIDSYRSYKDENYVSDDGDDEYSKISRMQDMHDYYHNDHTSSSDDHDMIDE